MGIDLLVYQDHYKSFLLLQYKMLEKHKTKEATCRIDHQFTDQLDKMHRVSSVTNQSNHEISMPEWRLNSDPFYFKFCKRIQQDDSGPELIPGLIIHHEHIQNNLENYPGQTGSHKYFSVDERWRHLTNTQFVDLARYGWIGSGPAAFDRIREILSESQRAGRQQTLVHINKSRRR